MTRMKCIQRNSIGLQVSLGVIVLIGSGCRNDDGEQLPAPSPPVTASIDMEWEDRSAYGEIVDDLVETGSGNVYASIQGDVFLYETVSGQWTLTGIEGFQFVETADGSLITDKGYRLLPGSDNWHKEDFEGRLSISSDGRTLLKAGETRDVIEISYDNGETWNSLPAAPGNIQSFAIDDGTIYAGLSLPDPGLWTLAIGSDDWIYGDFDEFLVEIMPGADGSLTAVASYSAFWSKDGTAWETLETQGFFYSVDIVGRDISGAPLVAFDGSVLRSKEGELETVLNHPPGLQIYAMEMRTDSDYLLGGRNGVWEVTVGDEIEEQHLGLPGDFVQEVFHIEGGTFGSVIPSAPWGIWSRAVVGGDSWDAEAVLNNRVTDVFELPDGTQLLASVNIYEGGYGDLFLRNSVGELETRLRAAPELVSVAADGSGRWFVSTATGLEGPDNSVLMSGNGGATWSVADLNSTIPMKVLSHCSTIHAVGSDGIYQYRDDDDRWELTKRMTADSVTAVAQNNVLAVSTGEQLWVKKGCDELLNALSVPSGTALTSISIAPDGAIWGVSSGEGLVLTNSGIWKAFGSELKGELSYVSIAPDGTVWVRIEGKGLWSGARY